jgi:tRNA-Thr(GGU) m(6)t(6)A37 methyltransferase TsaA
MPESEHTFALRVIGHVESSLTVLEHAPRQPDEGAPAAVLMLDPAVAAGLAGLAVGQPIILVTWLHRADRTRLQVHPRGDLTRPSAGVFGTRSAERPNPIGLHRVVITSIEGHRVGVSALEALHGTPIIDLKPLLSEDVSLR